MLLNQKSNYYRGFEFLPLPTIVTGFSGIIEYSNSATCLMLGYKPDEILGKRIFDYIFPESEYNHEVVIQQLIQKQNVKSNFVLKTKDDSTLFIQFVQSMIFNDAMEPLVIVGNFIDQTEGKKQWEEVKQSEARYKMLLDNAFDAIYLTKGFKYQYVNKQFTELTGYSFDEVTDPSFDYKVLLTEKSLEIWKDRETRRRNGENVSPTYMFQFIDKFNKIHDVELSTTIIETGDEKSVLGIMRDVTVLIATNRVLDWEKTYLESIYNIVPYGIAILDENDRVLDVNTAFVEMFQWNLSELQNQPINNFIVPKTLKEEGKFFTKIVTTGKRVDVETIRQRKDGKQLNVKIIGKPTKLPDGKLVVFGIYQDITSRKIVENELKFERNLMEALMANIPDTIYFKDTESKFLRINQAQAKALGVAKPEDAVGKSDLDFFNNELVMKSFEDERKIFFEGDRLVNSQEHIKTALGWKWFSASKVPMFDESGNIIGLAGVSRDITDIKNLESILLEREENLKILNAEKDKLFSIIAHDLRSPFNSFLMLTEIFMNDSMKISAEETKKLTVSMHRSATNLYDLLENLLSWSRMQRGLTHIEPLNINLLENIKSSLDIFTAMIRSKMLKINLEIPNELMVEADVSLLGSILRNLLSNAIKFTLHGGCVTVSVIELPENEVLVSIIDSGIGMDDEIKQNLFSIETKGRKGTEGEPSSGLGLILVKDFVEKHGGKLFVESEVNQGSTFSFTLQKSV